jgi:transcriptional regulator with XRE-family HTH domain
MKTGSPKSDSAAIDAVIGTRVRQRRLEKKMSQTDLANELGLTFQQVQKYEKGTNRLSLSRALKVAEVLDTTVEYFVRDLGGARAPKASPVEKLLATKYGADLVEIVLSLKTPQQLQHFVTVAAGARNMCNGRAAPRST